MSESYPPPPPPPHATPKISIKALIAAIVIILVVVALPIGYVLLTGNGNTQHPQTTAMPTAHAPTPTPRLTPSGTSNMAILSYSDYFDPDLGYFNVVGEVRNSLGTNVKYVKIVGTFYDAHNTVIATDYTFSQIDILKPNQKSPFLMTVYPNKISPASYKLSVEYQETQDQPFEGLTILSQTTSTDIVGYYNINGEVKNGGVSEATNVQVVATYYNSAGTVIGTSYTYTDPDTISVGGTSPFEVSSYPLVISPARYELQVQGQ